MGPAFWSEMPEVFANLDADRDVHAVVLTGSGKNFSYGLDLPAMGGSLSGVLSDGTSARPRADFHRNHPADARRDQRRRRLPYADRCVSTRVVHRRRR